MELIKPKKEFFFISSQKKTRGRPGKTRMNSTLSHNPSTMPPRFGLRLNRKRTGMDCLASPSDIRPLSSGLRTMEEFPQNVRFSARAVASAGFSPEFFLNICPEFFSKSDKRKRKCKWSAEGNGGKIPFTFAPGIAISSVRPRLITAQQAPCHYD